MVTEKPRRRRINTAKAGAVVASTLGMGVGMAVFAAPAMASTSFFYCSATKAVNAGCSGHWHHNYRNVARNENGGKIWVDAYVSGFGYTSPFSSPSGRVVSSVLPTRPWALPRCWNGGPSTAVIHCRQYF